MKYLYRYETKGIQSWILSSNKLRDLAGGSALVESLTQTAKSAVMARNAEVIQATSGAMTAVFSTKEDLEAFASEWPMQVAYRAPGLQLVQAWVPATEKMQTLFDALARRRNSTPLTDLELNPWVLRAGQSGLPAVPASGFRSAARKTTMDQVAVAKERARESEYYGKEAPVTGGRKWSEFEERVEYWPEGPIAVVHADGSGVGQRLMKVSDNEALTRFSKAMKDASDAAIRAAVDCLDSSDGVLMARPIVSAGDDLTYILPAKDARRFTEHWLHAFEAETKARLGGDGGLRGGAGIVMLHRGYPFSGAYALAEELCKAAKDAIKAQNVQRSVFAFKRVTNSLVDDISDGAVAWILGPPSQSSPLDKLVDAVRSLPRGTLRVWLDHFQRPQGAAQAARLWARAEEVADSRLWSDFTNALEAVGADPAGGQFRSSSNVDLAMPLGSAKATPISDALTLRFVERKETVHA